MVAVEWIGIRLPSSNPIISFDLLTGRLTKRQQGAVQELDEAMVHLVRIEGTTSFSLGPKDGLSKHYKWSPRNRYVEQMTESDARIVLNRIGERLQFRNLDDPRQRDREATYPEPSYIANFVSTQFSGRGGQFDRIVRPGHLPSSIVARLLRQARRRERLGEEAKVIGRRIGRWGAPP